MLNCYAKNGVPQRAGSLGFDHPALSDALKYLQNMDRSWRDFVDSEAMSENEVKIQTAIWELVTTEVDYIHALQTVTDVSNNPMTIWNISSSCYVYFYSFFWPAWRLCRRNVC